MAEPKGNRGKNPIPQAPGRKEPVGDLVPPNPLPARKALLQVSLLVGIPLALLFLARFLLRQFFPSLGY